MENIQNLISKKGSWAARAFVEDAIPQILDNIETNFSFPKDILDNSSGLSAQRYLTRYSELINIPIEIPDKNIVDKETWQLIDLHKVKEKYPTGYFSKVWIEKLLSHLNCNKDEVVEKLNEVFSLDFKPQTTHLQIIKDWSWPFIEKLYKVGDLDKKLDFKYIESNLAKFVWRKWYITNRRQLFLIDTTSKSNLTFGQWFIFRALHDATHLLHISTYPEQPKPTDPNWLIVMEALAINTEYEFYNLIENGDLSSLPTIENFDVDIIKTYLILYLLDRTLRVDFDILVHLEENTIEQWYKYVEELTGLNNSNELCKEFLDITTEFHGLPGLGSAYFLGIEALKKEDDKKAVWLGENKLNYFV